MSKGYTKQEVEDWQNWANKKTDQVAKDGETYEYELFLTHEDGTGFIVDCREDIVVDGDVVTSEYTEGFIFDDYFEAEKKLKTYQDLIENAKLESYSYDMSVNGTMTFNSEFSFPVNESEGLLISGTS